MFGLGLLEILFLFALLGIVAMCVAYFVIRAANRDNQPHR